MEYKKEKQEVSGWAAVVFTVLDTSQVPALVETIKEGFYQNPQEALRLADKMCHEMQGKGYTIEPYYSPSL